MVGTRRVTSLMSVMSVTSVMSGMSVTSLLSVMSEMLVMTMIVASRASDNFKPFKNLYSCG